MVEILHTLAIPDIYSYRKITGKFDYLITKILTGLKNDTLKQEDIKYVVPTGKEFTPELRLERRISKFVLCINDGETVRFKRGPLNLLLQWALDEIAKGHIGRHHSCFLSPIYKKV